MADIQSQLRATRANEYFQEIASFMAKHPNPAGEILECLSHMFDEARRIDAAAVYGLPENASWDDIKACSPEVDTLQFA